MQTGQALRMGADTLRGAGVPDPETDAAALLCGVTALTPLTLRLTPGRELEPEQEERFRSLLLLRTRREPLQYLLGTQCFYGLDFHVDARVLIPRPETELLCELAIDWLREWKAPRVADVCTGSGAIAVTLKHHCPQAEVWATDISADALAVARENARRNAADVHFLQGDLLEPLRNVPPLQMIVCNPPYVERDACAALQPEVRYEPPLALNGGADGLDFYRRLAQEAPNRLLPGGYLLLEIGDAQGARVAALLEATRRFTDITVRRDLCDRERFVTARCALPPT